VEVVERVGDVVGVTEVAVAVGVGMGMSMLELEARSGRRLMDGGGRTGRARGISVCCLLAFCLDRMVAWTCLMFEIERVRRGRGVRGRMRFAF
jgi:hypothetical protein